MTLIDLLLLNDYKLSRAAIDISSSRWVLRGLVEVGTNFVEVKGLIPAICFWYLWSKPCSNLETRRIKLSSLLIVSVFAIAVGRALATLLPFRLRPLGTAEIMGDSVQTNEFLENWSSMPSDHALLFFALAAGFYQVSRPVGVLLLIHAFFVVGLSRVLGGQHYPSDIIVGAIIGAFLSFCLVPPIARLISRTLSTKPALVAQITRPEIVYPVLFFVTFQFANMFDGVRYFGLLAAKVVSKFALAG